ncbi:TetR/AcrR family transcriptional regulator [Microbacterium esteraromaticum]|uniref:TetR/AcrR family transcriptional regulator n=1 Tax=Microbacterium esteraromaticum TaxID=57043 RepID=A0A7D8ABM0_9MICO|nr:TetR/AcrR family transcriptional regulator [Microbacterium esteraromaticum]QMU96864.1 TetR/AcrR family transcriptional regulator [Microbacterium esteraromaticum]
MRSASDDLTARARIREAAIRAFARDGFDATSMRAIAKDAGVSAALIVHHFGDKSSLRAACDDYVLAAFLDDKHELIEAPTADRIRAALNDVERYGPYVDYLGRMLSDSSPAADRLFDEIIEVTRSVLDEQRAAGLLVEMSDPEMTTLLVAMMGLAPVMMRTQIGRVLGQDQLSPAGMLRTTLPTLELLTHGIYSSTAFLDGARQAVASAAEQFTETRTPKPTEGGAS